MVWVKPVATISDNSIDHSWDRTRDDASALPTELKCATVSPNSKLILHSTPAIATSIYLASTMFARAIGSLIMSIDP